MKVCDGVVREFFLCESENFFLVVVCECVCVSSCVLSGVHGLRRVMKLLSGDDEW